MLTLEQMRKRRKEAAVRMKALHDAAAKEERDLSEEEDKEFRALDTEVEDLDAKIKRAERVAELEKRTTATEPPPDPELDPERRGGLPKAPAGHTREERPYSLINLCRAAKSGDASIARVERRASDEIAERIGRDAEGYFVPFRELLPEKERRELETRDITKATTGAELVGNPLLPSEFIEILRPDSIVARLGARMIPGLVGDVDLPRQAAAGTIAWLAAETTDLATDTSFDMDEVQLRPKTVGVRHDISRRMLKQSTPAVEEIVREDIRQTIALAIDLAAINGSGAGGQPLGIIGTAGVGTVNVTGGATYADTVEFITDLGVANALRGRLGYAVHPSIWGALKTASKDTGSGQFLIEPDGMMNGYPLALSSQIPTADGGILFGNWAELLIGMWGVLDLFPDPYTLGDRGGVVLRGFQDIDVQLRHPASFAISDIP